MHILQKYVSGDGKTIFFEISETEIVFKRTIDNTIIKTVMGCIEKVSSDRNRLLICSIDSIRYIYKTDGTFIKEIMPCMNDMEYCLGSNVDFIYRYNYKELIATISRTDSNKIFKIGYIGLVEITEENGLLFKCSNIYYKLIEDEYVLVPIPNTPFDNFYIFGNYLVLSFNGKLSIYKDNLNHVKTYNFDIIRHICYYKGNIYVVNSDNLEIIDIENPEKIQRIKLKPNTISVIPKYWLCVIGKNSYVLNKDVLTSPILASICKKDNSPVSRLTLDAFSAIYKFIS